MKIAIPIDGNDVATVLDFAREIMVFTYGPDSTLHKERLSLPLHIPSLHAQKLLDLSIDMLICGAISDSVAAMIWHQGIDILPGLSGRPDTIVYEFFAGRNRLSAYMLPGFEANGWKGCCNRYGRKSRSGRQGMRISRT
jgi:predicted Fe-Mo cluster-binding NifX family protein